MENDDSDLRVFCLFILYYCCFHFSLLSNQQTLSIEEILNKNVNHWTQNLTIDAPIPHNGACIYKQHDTVYREWGTSQVGRNKESRALDFIALGKGWVTVVPKDVTQNRKGVTQSRTVTHFCISVIVFTPSYWISCQGMPLTTTAKK